MNLIDQLMNYTLIVKSWSHDHCKWMFWRTIQNCGHRIRTLTIIFFYSWMIFDDEFFYALLFHYWTICEEISSKNKFELIYIKRGGSVARSEKWHHVQTTPPNCLNFLSLLSILSVQRNNKEKLLPFENIPLFEPSIRSIECDVIWCVNHRFSFIIRCLSMVKIR